MITLEQLGVEFKFIENDDYLYDEVNFAINGAKPHPQQPGWDAYWNTFERPGAPTYLNRENGVFRYLGNFISAPANTEQQFAAAFSRRCFETYFSHLDAVLEFGCGSGMNLLQLKSMYPHLQLLGLDWSGAAVRLVSAVAPTRVFDMCRPSIIERPKGKVGILTAGSMEQLGDNFEAFLKFLVDFDADVNLHIEPLIELYDPDCEFDALAIRYHKARGYLGNFVTKLRQQLPAFDCARTGFGNKFCEGYMLAAWSNDGLPRIRTIK